METRIVIKKNQYRDSVFLMVINEQTRSLPGINEIAVMMGTDNNKDIIKEVGFFGPEIDSATSRDIVICIRARSDEEIEKALAQIDEMLTRKRRPEELEDVYKTLINYYTRDLVNFSLLHPGELFSRPSFPKNADRSDSGQIASDPQGIYQVLKWANSFKLPILITENGVDNANDQLRPRYLIEHLHQVWRTVNFNWPIKGYFHWTLVDNFEWERGWTQRFGLWELDPDTQTRRKRPSADLYAEICRENGISTEMVARYAPEIVEKLFPGFR